MNDGDAINTSASRFAANSDQLLARTRVITSRLVHDKSLYGNMRISLLDNHCLCRYTQVQAGNSILSYCGWLFHMNTPHTVRSWQQGINS